LHNKGQSLNQFVILMPDGVGKSFEPSVIPTPDGDEGDNLPDLGKKLLRETLS
jgi:hypothetical protein